MTSITEAKKRARSEEYAYQASSWKKFLDTKQLEVLVRESAHSKAGDSKMGSPRERNEALNSEFRPSTALTRQSDILQKMKQAVREQSAKDVKAINELAETQHLWHEQLLGLRSKLKWLDGDGRRRERIAKMLAE